MCGVENQPPGEPCANDAKVCDGEGKCVDPCTEDETRCAPLGEKVEQCKNGIWIDAEACSGETKFCFDPPLPSSEPATCWDGTPRASVDTTNGHVKFNNTTTEGPAGTLTVATWLKSGSSNSGGILLTNGKGGSYCSSLELSFVPTQAQTLATRFNVWGGGGSDKCEGSVFPLGMWPTNIVTFSAQAWTHLAITKEAGAVKVFVNGNQAGDFNGTDYAPYTPANRDFWLGAGMNVSGAPVVNFAGRIAHFQVWSRVLSAVEVAKVASRAGAMPTDMSALYGYWPLDEGTGTVAHDAGPNGRDGTLSAGNLW
jgi:hypothetical protein